MYLKTWRIWAICEKYFEQFEMKSGSHLLSLFLVRTWKHVALYIFEFILFQMCWGEGRPVVVRNSVICHWALFEWVVLLRKYSEASGKVKIKLWLNRCWNLRNRTQEPQSLAETEALQNKITASVLVSFYKNSENVRCVTGGMIWSYIYEKDCHSPND